MPAGSPGGRQDRCRAHAPGGLRVPAGGAGGTWGNWRHERRPGDGVRRLSFYDRWRPPVALAPLQATQALVAVGPFSSSARRRPWLVLPLCPLPMGPTCVRGHVSAAPAAPAATGYFVFGWQDGSGACLTLFLQQCALYTMRQRTLPTSIDAIAQAVPPRRRPRRPQPRASSLAVTPRARPARAGGESGRRKRAPGQAETPQAMATPPPLPRTAGRRGALRPRHAALEYALSQYAHGFACKIDPGYQQLDWSRELLYIERVPIDWHDSYSHSRSWPHKHRPISGNV